MISLSYRFKNNKKLLILAIILGVAILVDLLVLIFDIVQFVEVSKNVTNRFAGFESLNILAGIISVIAIISIIVYLIFCRRKIKVDISQKDKRR